MIVGIDIRVLGNTVKSGIEEYTENLLSHMLPLDRNIRYKLFYSSYNDQLPDFDWLHLQNVELKKYNFSNKLLFGTSRIFNRPYLDKLVGGADVFFFPHFFLASLSRLCKRVTTFHDLSFIRFPEYFSWRKNIWHRLEMMPEWQSRFSDRIISVSESTKSDLVEKFKINPSKIKVVYSGISETIKRHTDDDLINFKVSHSLPNKFILSLGKLEPRKNVASIILAFNLLKNYDGFDDLNLIIAGASGWLNEDLFKEYKASPFKNQIIFVNQLNDNERPYYYSLAEAFIYPSLFEGFGFPPLEAMACETPVVVSNNSSLPEVVGNAGMLVNARNISEITFAIKKVLENDALKHDLAKRGINRVAKFSWQKAATETLETIIKV